VATIASAQEKTSDDKAEVVLPTLGDRLTEDQVVAFANLAMKNIHTEYPNKPSNVVVDEASVRTPKTMHPAFYGCFDWHSSVHGHWMLIRLLKDYPDSEINAQIREKLAISLTKENLDAELAYFNESQHKSFERTYGWAWYLRMVDELETWDDEQGQQWRENMRGLEALLVQRTLDYLPKLSYPIRTGLHPDSGFALAQILDYSRTLENKQLEDAIVKRARDFYLADVDYPTLYEPSGQDFFSSCLNEADLMRRVLSQEEFVEWFDKYLPELKAGDGGNLLVPVIVSDVTDGYIVHLAGLDLSRAWCMQGIASALPKSDPRAQLLMDSATKHAETGFGYVFSGHYEGDHWLATFAIYLQARVGVDETRISTNPRIPVAADEDFQSSPLAIKVRVDEKEISLTSADGAGSDKPASEAKVYFSIINRSDVAQAEVDITLLVSPGIKLSSFDYGKTGLSLINRSDDFTKFYVKRCPTLESGKELKFVATVNGTKLGSSAFVVRAASSGSDAAVGAQVLEVSE
jgi:hypothetical protein